MRQFLDVFVEITGFFLPGLGGSSTAVAGPFDQRLDGLGEAASVQGGGALR